ncbi:MAPEG family protein [Devosia equisanguinis]|uniref:MAPEG family protein n=1 Tax=Devosia equisanguinis TaxID=2490941 RepID=A0A447IE25_9HYPH|nr:MAPEG family protein [Devosia equisanguinis]VDS05682.1 MAPEG family protein [Devosia equisanguinis]
MTLTIKLIILAMAAQVFLSMGILVLLGRERVPRIMSGEIPVATIAVERDAYPLKARLLSNNFDNQFQLPVLFYVGAILSLYAAPGWPEAGLAWLFVASRYIHAYIHVTHNRVTQRFMAYVAGLAILALFWLWLVVRLVILAPSV